MVEKNKRAGRTEITSVSISTEFKRYIEIHEISPTEALRIGISVLLHEKGVPQFQNDRTKRRVALIKQLNNMQNLVELPEKILEVEKMLKEVREILT